MESDLDMKNHEILIKNPTRNQNLISLEYFNNHINNTKQFMRGYYDKNKSHYIDFIGINNDFEIDVRFPFNIDFISLSLYVTSNLSYATVTDINNALRHHKKGQ